METRTITQLDTAGTIDTDDVMEIEVDGVSKKVTTQVLADTIIPFGTTIQYGMVVSNNGTQAVDISAGVISDSTGAIYIKNTSTFTKSITTPWAAGSGNGGLAPSGTSVASNITYYVHGLRKDSDGSFDAMFDTSITAANAPSGYTAYRKLRTTYTDTSKQFYTLTSPLTTNSIIQNYFSPMTSYTPTFTGFGTVSSYIFNYARSGNWLDIIGKFTVATATAVEARISLPNSFISDTTIIPSIMACGIIVYGAIGSSIYYCLIESGVPYITMGRQTATTAGLTKINGNNFSPTDILSIQCRIPIQGWNS